jgi:hypothetical protein
VAGDMRWCGAYGIQADFIARSHCSVEIISTEDIKVLLLPTELLCFCFDQ